MRYVSYSYNPVTRSLHDLGLSFKVPERTHSCTERHRHSSWYMLQAQEEKAVDAEDAPAEEGGDAAGPEAVSGGSKEEVEVPQPADKANENHAPADAVQQELKEGSSTKQAEQASNGALDTKPKVAEGDIKEKGAATVVSDKEPEVPAAAITSDKKPDEKSESGPQGVIAGTAADTSMGKFSNVAREPESDKHASKHLAADSASAPSMPQNDQLTEEPAGTAAQRTALPQAAADDSAAPQVDVLGSVEVAAPLQVIDSTMNSGQTLPQPQLGQKEVVYHTALP